MRVRIGIFGGTFDPVHLGHLDWAKEVLQSLGLDQMRLMPAQIPPHRDVPSASAEMRVRMVNLALQDYPELSLDARELRRVGPSYTIDSLRELRAELGADAGLYFVMGMDSLNTLASWRSWQALTDFAHLVVLARPGELPPSANSEVGLWLSSRQVSDKQALLCSPSGAVWLMSSLQRPISATAIRAAIERGQSVDQWLSPAVSHFIAKNKLYLS